MSMDELLQKVTARARFVARQLGLHQDDADSEAGAVVAEVLADKAVVHPLAFAKRRVESRLIDIRRANSRYVHKGDAFWDRRRAPNGSETIHDETNANVNPAALADAGASRRQIQAACGISERAARKFVEGRNGSRKKV